MKLQTYSVNDVFIVYTIRNTFDVKNERVSSSRKERSRVVRQSFYMLEVVGKRGGKYKHSKHVSKFLLLLFPFLSYCFVNKSGLD